MSGRRAEAARNDQKIIDAARAVFIQDPESPISAVAARAGVGISALYRRHPSKEELLRRLARDGLERYVAEADAALADQGDPWQAFERFMRRIVDADTASITLRLAGTFRPTKELYELANTSQKLNVRLLERTRSAGAIRSDIEVDDLALIIEQLAAIRVGDEHRTSQLRHRYLALVLDGLRASSPGPLPGPAPTWEEISGRWDVSRRP
jgi:AcrR family transcriptional regulator